MMYTVDIPEYDSEVSAQHLFLCDNFAGNEAILVKLYMGFMFEDDNEVLCEKLLVLLVVHCLLGGLISLFFFFFLGLGLKRHEM